MAKFSLQENRKTLSFLEIVLNYSRQSWSQQNILNLKIVSNFTYNSPGQFWIHLSASLSKQISVLLTTSLSVHLPGCPFISTATMLFLLSRFWLLIASKSCHQSVDARKFRECWGNKNLRLPSRTLPCVRLPEIKKCAVLKCWELLFDPIGINRTMMH